MAEKKQGGKRPGLRHDDCRSGDTTDEKVGRSVLSFSKRDGFDGESRGCRLTPSSGESAEPCLEVVADGRNESSPLHDVTSCGCFLLDEDGLILNVDLTGSILLGIDGSTLLGMPFAHFVRPSDIQLFQRHFEKVFESQNRQTCLLGMTSRGAGSFPVRLVSYAVKGIDEGSDRCRTIMYDVNAENGLENSPRPSGWQLLRIAESLPIGVVYVDAEECLRFSNRVLERWLELMPGEICGRTIEEILGREVYRSIEKHIRTALLGKEVAFERVLLRNEVAPRLLAMSLIPDVDPRGEVRGLIGLISDITVFKHTEEILRQKVRELQLLIDNTQEGIWVFDTQALTLFCNPRMAEMLGYSLAEMMGRSLASCLDEDASNSVDILMDAAFRNIPMPHDVELVGKDGKKISSSIVVSPALDSEGKFKGMTACVSDISERVRAETILRLSESRFRHIYDDAPIMMHSINEEGIILNANRKWLESLGYDRDEAIGRSLDFIMTGESSRRAFKEILPVYWKVGKVTDVPYRYVKKDGTFMEVLLDSTVMDDPVWGKISLSVVRDVTEANRAQRARRESEERFQALFEGARDCIYIKDISLRYTHVNPAMGNLFGLQPSEIIGKTAVDLFGKAAGKQVREVDLRVLDGESVEEERTRPVNGVEMTFHDIRIPLRNADGEVVGLCGFARNITEIKKVVLQAPTITAQYPSQTTKDTLAKARHAAAKDSIVLLLGESGTGKDFLARWIHNLSRRAKGPFFAINCAAVPHNLAESELFGHERGAFTGALGRKRGLLELAEGGTLLLNEIGELPLPLQSKLLTFLDTRSFLRVGGEKSIHVDARLIAATHRDLKVEVERGRFLEALYYRLNVFTLEVPPLRERIADIPLLVREIMNQLAAEMQLNETPAPDAGSIEALSRYHWPGNVRELRNVLERSLMLSGDKRLKVTLPLTPLGTRDWSFKLDFPEKETLHDVVDRVIQELCIESLRRSAGNRNKAARLLGISRDSLYRYMKRFDTEQDE